MVVVWGGATIKGDFVQMKEFCILTVVVVTGVYTSDKMAQNYAFSKVNFGFDTVLQLYKM